MVDAHTGDDVLARRRSRNRLIVPSRRQFFSGIIPNFFFSKFIFAIKIKYFHSSLFKRIFRFYKLLNRLYYELSNDRAIYSVIIDFQLKTQLYSLLSSNNPIFFLKKVLFASFRENRMFTFLFIID